MKISERIIALGEPWPEDPADKTLRELAREYHERTEAYDRSVCTGPIDRGRIMPANSDQFSAINKHAKMVREELTRRIPVGKSTVDLHREILSYRETR
jgi:hypothetical protein